MIHRMFSGLAILAVFALSAGQALALAGGPTLVVQPSKSPVAINEQFTATVLIDTKTHPVTAAELHITFPADKLQAISIGPGTFLSNVIQNGSTGSGTASIIVGSGTAAKQGTGSVAVITFRALAAGTPLIGFDSSTQVAASDQTSNAVDTMAGASVTISAGGAGGVTNTPTNFPVVGTSPPGVIVIGGTLAPTPVSVGQVSTGPGEVTALAVVIGMVSALLYVGYTRTGSYQRAEVQSIAAEAKEEPMDFRS